MQMEKLGSQYQLAPYGQYDDVGDWRKAVASLPGACEALKDPHLTITERLAIAQAIQLLQVSQVTHTIKEIRSRC